MDQLCADLQIPRTHLRPAKQPLRFSLLAHRGWLAALLRCADDAPPANDDGDTPPTQRTTTFPEFRALKALSPAAATAPDEEWPADERWQTVHLSVSVIM